MDSLGPGKQNQVLFAGNRSSWLLCLQDLTLLIGLYRSINDLWRTLFVANNLNLKAQIYAPGWFHSTVKKRDRGRRCERVSESPSDLLGGLVCDIFLSLVKHHRKCRMQTCAGWKCGQTVKKLDHMLIVDGDHDAFSSQPSLWLLSCCGWRFAACFQEVWLVLSLIMSSALQSTEPWSDAWNHCYMFVKHIPPHSATNILKLRSILFQTYVVVGSFSILVPWHRTCWLHSMCHI